MPETLKRQNPEEPRPSGETGLNRIPPDIGLPNTSAPECHCNKSEENSPGRFPGRPGIRRISAPTSGITLSGRLVKTLGKAPVRSTAFWRIVGEQLIRAVPEKVGKAIRLFLAAKNVNNIVILPSRGMLPERMNAWQYGLSGPAASDHHPKRPKCARQGYRRLRDDREVSQIHIGTQLINTS